MEWQARQEIYAMGVVGENSPSQGSRGMGYKEYFHFLKSLGCQGHLEVDCYKQSLGKSGMAQVYCTEFYY